VKLIFIHGPVGSGKLTVARELCAQTGLALFHNHLVVDAVGAVFAFGSEPFARLREEFWLAVFEDAAKADRSLVFTFAPERTVNPQFISETIARVATHGGEVSFVALTLSRDEQLRRIGADSRKSHGKLTSTELYERLEAGGAFQFPPLPDGLVLDSGALAPMEAARQISRHFGLA
jgi:cytidylate kinase